MSDGLLCTGGCGRRLVGLADPDGILHAFTCSECQPVDSESATAWHTDSGGSYTRAEAEDRLREFGSLAARLMSAVDEDEAARWIVGDRLDSAGLRERVAELEAERDALLERLARRDDEVTRLRSRA